MYNDGFISVTEKWKQDFHNIIICILNSICCGLNRKLHVEPPIKVYLQAYFRVNPAKVSTLGKEIILNFHPQMAATKF